jgi:hypothetical protein
MLCKTCLGDDFWHQKGKRFLWCFHIVYVVFYGFSKYFQPKDLGATVDTQVPPSSKRKKIKCSQPKEWVMAGMNQFCVKCRTGGKINKQALESEERARTLQTHAWVVCVEVFLCFDIRVGDCGACVDDGDDGVDVLIVLMRWRVELLKSVWSEAANLWISAVKT